MIIHEGYENLNLTNPVVTIGVFDGVHRGHRVILDHLVRKANQTGGESVVITLDPHPRLVLSNKEEEIFFLSSFEEKGRLLESAGIDHLVIIRFDNLVSNMQASEFIEKILVGEIGIKYLIVGYDSHFGRNREGDPDAIRECSRKYKFSFEQVAELQTEEVVISSSLIREALQKGKIEEANRWLGYSYSLTGTIVEGRRLGRSLGFPTANVKPLDKFKLIPGNGVYAAEIMLDDKKFKGMLSIGFNPTVNKEKKHKSVEVHIFDFDADLYGRSITILFRFRLRDEKKFGSLTELTKQIDLDKRASLKLLK